MSVGLSDPPFVENIYKASRRIKRTENTVYNALRSIYEDSLFVEEIRNIWKELPLIANLRCGLWYAREFDGLCYFKSTDGHNGNWSFNTTRLNLHVATLAAERGGCCIVDATRKGKRFPDSMSKTIPIWACVLNRALSDFCLPRTQGNVVPFRVDTAELNGKSAAQGDPENGTCNEEDWDCSLHLPLWVSQLETANIESRIQGWVEPLKTAGADLDSLAKALKKPLRPLWLSQKTVIWLNEVPTLDDWPFTPIFLLSASRPCPFTQRFADAEFSWTYIPGAADDEESWARGLTPALFWKNSLYIVRSGPGTCNAKVSAIIEQDRVYRAVRGHYAPQVRARGLHRASSSSLVHQIQIDDYGTNTPTNKCNRLSTAPAEKACPQVMEICSIGNNNAKLEYSGRPAEKGRTEIRSLSVSIREPPQHMIGFHWIGDTGLAVGNADWGNSEEMFEVVDCIVNCGTSRTFPGTHTESYLYLPIVGAKFDRHGLQASLGHAVSFVRKKLMDGSTIFIYCSNGEDISVCVCLAVVLSCFGSHAHLSFVLQ